MIILDRGSMTVIQSDPVTPAQQQALAEAFAAHVVRSVLQPRQHSRGTGKGGTTDGKAPGPEALRV